MKHILTGLRNKGIQVSIEKTVAILELQGPGASACLARYVVERPQHQGKFRRFVINGVSEYVKIVPQHVYLGVVIGFKKYDQATARHRMDLAKGTFSRLSCREVAVKLRLLLWNGSAHTSTWLGLHWPSPRKKSKPVRAGATLQHESQAEARVKSAINNCIRATVNENIVGLHHVRLLDRLL